MAQLKTFPNFLITYETERLELHAEAGEKLYVEFGLSSDFFSPFILKRNDASGFAESGAIWPVTDEQAAEYAGSYYIKPKAALYVRAGYFPIGLFDKGVGKLDIAPLTAGIGWRASGGLQIEAELLHGFASQETLLGASIGYHPPQATFCMDGGLGVFTTLVPQDSAWLASSGWRPTDLPQIIPFFYGDLCLDIVKDSKLVAGFDFRTWLVFSRFMKMDSDFDRFLFMLGFGILPCIRYDLGFHWYF